MPDSIGLVRVLERSDGLMVWIFSTLYTIGQSNSWRRINIRTVAADCCFILLQNYSTIRLNSTFFT